MSKNLDLFKEILKKGDRVLFISNEEDLDLQPGVDEGIILSIDKSEEEYPLVVEFDGNEPVEIAYEEVAPVLTKHPFKLDETIICDDSTNGITKGFNYVVLDICLTSNGNFGVKVVNDFGNVRCYSVYRFVLNKNNIKGESEMENNNNKNMKGFDEMTKEIEKITNGVEIIGELIDAYKSVTTPDGNKVGYDSVSGDAYFKNFITLGTVYTTPKGKSRIIVDTIYYPEHTNEKSGKKYDAEIRFVSLGFDKDTMQLTGERTNVGKDYLLEKCKIETTSLFRKLAIDKEKERIEKMLEVLENEKIDEVVTTL